MNTPLGKVLRHNWLKNTKMYADLNKVSCDIDNDLCDKTTFIAQNYYDEQDFPNSNENGYEYFE